MAEAESVKTLETVLDGQRMQKAEDVQTHSAGRSVQTCFRSPVSRMLPAAPSEFPYSSTDAELAMDSAGDGSGLECRSKDYAEELHDYRKGCRH